MKVYFKFLEIQESVFWYHPFEKYTGRKEKRSLF